MAPATGEFSAIAVPDHLPPSDSASSVATTASSSSADSSGKAPSRVKRVPPPKISHLPETQAESPALLTATNGSGRPGAMARSSSYGLNDLAGRNRAQFARMSSYGALTTATASSSPLGPFASKSRDTLLLTPTGSALLATPSHSSTSSSASTITAMQPSPLHSRPMLPSRSSSGGGKIAAFASKFGSTASQTMQRMASATHHATSSAANALGSNRGGDSGSSLQAASTPSSGSSTPTDLQSSRAFATALKGRGTNLVAGAAARLGKGKGKARSGKSISALEDLGLDGNEPKSTRTEVQAQQPSADKPAQSRTMGSATLARAPSGKSKYLYGVRVPSGRAGEVFGAPLRVAADRTKLSEDFLPDLPGANMEDAERRREASRVLPAITIRCMDYLNEYGRSEEGLYRIPGSSNQVSNLKAIFDAGVDLDMLKSLSIRDVEPSAVASCFKLWLRELPDSLLHSLEREIDILLMEHTGNAASAKVTMAQAQSPSQPSHSPTLSTSGKSNSVLVVDRIKDLFERSLPVENVILLRQICYHLAHLDQFSAKTKMTLANLRLILSPTLRLSPAMLSILVSERDRIFPRPGRLDLSTAQPRRPSRLTLFQPISVDTSGTFDLKFPTEAPVLPLPDGLEEHRLPPLPTWDSEPTRPPISSTNSEASGADFPNAGRTSGGYRASWHVVDLPRSCLDSMSAASDEHASTPIAKKFLHSRNASSDLLARSTSSNGSVGSQKVSPPTSSVMSRTPTLSGRDSPSPFFSAGAPTAGLGLVTSHARKRSSCSSVHSVQSTNDPTGALANSVSRYRSHRRSGSQASIVQTQTPSAHRTERSGSQEEEEELSSSDTNTSICSSVSSAATPKDSLDLDDADVRSESIIDTRRRTITAETYGLGGRSNEIRKKRGSVMLLSLASEGSDGEEPSWQITPRGGQIH